MKRINKKVLVIALIVVALLLVGGLSYALWTSSFTQTGTSSNTYDCFNVTFSDTEAYSLTNSYPLTDEEGLIKKPYEVTITNKCKTLTTYEVVLNEITGNTLDESLVRIATNNGINNLNALTQTIPQISGADSARIIDNGYLMANESKTVSIKAWMNENATLANGQNKTFDFKITINAIAGDNNYLAAKILSNSLIEETPNFAVGEPPASGENTGSGLYKTEDDLGNSYYFRGNVTNNVVSFANTLWEVVRINGDGTIRLRKSSTIGTKAFSTIKDHKYVGWTYDNSSTCTKANPCQSVYDATTNTFMNNKTMTNSDIKEYLENEWYIANLAVYDDKIAVADYCNDTTVNLNGSNLYYGSTARTTKPSLKCPDTDYLYGGLYKLKIGLLSIDEVRFAGFSTNEPYTTSSNYLYGTGYWWTMTPAYSNTGVANGQYVPSTRVTNNALTTVAHIFPVINLKSNTKIISGYGTSDYPYVVE